MSLKTLHLTNAWHRCSGGVGTFYRALLDAANDHQHFMRLVVPSESTYREEVGPYGRIYYLRAPRAPFNRSYRMLYPYRFLFPGTAIQDILNEERPDVIEVSEKYSLPYLAGLLRIQSLRGVAFRPTVIGLSCERMDENMAAYLSGSAIAESFCRWYMKWIYFPMFDHHIAVSEHAADELRLASRGHKVRRGVWIRPMGVDCDRFTPARKCLAVRERLLKLVNARPDSILLLYAGRVVPEKNLDLLVNMMQRLLAGGERDVRLLVAGQGMLLNEMRQKCERIIPGSVQFMGHVNDRDELADLFANCDVFVHPNHREPFGIAPLEAMASGLPLVGPNAGGITSYANAANAWLAEPRVEAFAAAVRSVVENPVEREIRLGAAITTAAQLQWPNVAESFLLLYAELHSRVQGVPLKDEVPPRFYSTLGNMLGQECFIPSSSNNHRM